MHLTFCITKGGDSEGLSFRDAKMKGKKFPLNKTWIMYWVTGKPNAYFDVNTNHSGVEGEEVYAGHSFMMHLSML